MGEHMLIGRHPTRRLVCAAVVAAFVATTGTASGAIDFAAKRDVAVGSGPVSIAVDDFNEDRKPDLAVANVTSPGNVAVLLGSGTGSFGSPTPFATGGDNPTALAVGDFNGDGNRDLAVADAFGMSNYSTESTYASLLLGDGAGGFHAGTPFLVSSALGYPQSVSAADVNGDGRQDLAFGGYRIVSTAYEALVVTLLGDGTGGFLDRTLITGGTAVRSLAAVDLNRDGNPDLATARSGREDFTGLASVLFGDGANNFGADGNGQWAADAGTGSTSVAVGDFNRDDRPDLALANYGSNDVSVFLGDGAGAFSGPTPFGAHDGPRSVAVGDFDGDGNQDLAVANAASRDVSILRGTGSGSFAAPLNFGAGEMATLAASRSHGDGGRLRVGDFDCNGTHDLAVANGVSGTVSILMNARPGTMQPGCLPPDTAVSGRVSASKIQKPLSKVRVKVKVAAGEALGAKATGTLALGMRSFRLKALTTTVAASQAKILSLRPRRAAHERMLAKALKQGKRVKATVTVKLTDQAGNTKSTTRRVTLRR